MVAFSTPEGSGFFSAVARDEDGNTSGPHIGSLASSNWIHGDKRFTHDALNSKTPSGPVNAYGMSKLFCEQTGAYFAEHHGLSVICLRIGWTQWTHDNQPGTHMAMGRWGQEMWLSDRDFLSGMRAAIDAKDVSLAALNLMSDNPGMRWDITETQQVIGYSPKDGSPAKVTSGAGSNPIFTATIY